jgi:transposase-like protein
MADLKTRGMNETLVFITDELKNIEGAILETYPDSKIQRCIVHKKRNILKAVRNKDKGQIMQDFNEVLNMNDPDNTVKKAVIKLDEFTEKWAKVYPGIKNMFIRKEEYFSYLHFPYPMRRMVYTNNWIEALNKQIKRTTKIRGAFPNERSAEKLVILRCMEIEENYKKYPITSLLFVQDQLDDMLLSRRKKPVLQTHKT